MQLDPPLKLAHRFPVSAAVALASIILTLLLFFGTNLDFLVATRDTFTGAPWTLLTSTFLHLGIIHLLFNLSWWWPFACRMEYAWGKTRLIAITVLFAVISGAAQIAFSRPGVGLSGVIYGVFTLIAVVHHTHPIFKGLISRNTIWMFAGFFVLFIILSLINILPVGNVAHGAGAAAGYLLGRAMIATPAKRAVWIAALVAFGFISIAGNFVSIPGLNSSIAARTHATQGTQAYTRGDYEGAARLLEAAYRDDPDNPAINFNLGLTYQQLGRDDEALVLFKKAVSLSPELRSDAAPVIASILCDQAAGMLKLDEPARADPLVNEALGWDPTNEDALELQRTIREKLSTEPEPK